jgi:hypothetical protein
MEPAGGEGEEKCQSVQREISKFRENRMKPKDGRWQPEKKKRKKTTDIYTAPKEGLASGVGRKDRPLENRMETLWATRGGVRAREPHDREFEITTKTHP